MAIRVFLADDHAVVRDGLRLLLESQGNITVIGEAADGRETVREVQRLRPEVVIMDIVMPSLNGIEATEQIHEICPSTKVIILSMYATNEHVFRALRAGAQGYLFKESAGQEVVDAVRVVYTGQQYLSNNITGKVIDDYIHARQVELAKSPLELLSSRERQILQLVVEGKSSKEVADILYISPKTVETYRCRLMEKLGIKDIPTLVKFAIQHGLTALR